MLFLIILNSFLQLHAQWAASYGGADVEGASSVIQTSDGGYILAGLTNSFGRGESDAWVLKLTLGGDIEWQYTYGGRNNDVASSIIQTTDGGYILAGTTESFGAGMSDVWVLKLSSSGEIEWQKTYGGSQEDKAESIMETSDEGFIIGGYTNSFGSGGFDIWILKLSSTGNLEWQYTYGVLFDDVAFSIKETSDEGYIVAGYTDFFGMAASKFWVLKLTPLGEVEWQWIYGGSYDDEACCIVQTSDGGYLLGGDTTSFSVGDSDFWILKLSSGGMIEWQRAYGGKDRDHLSSLIQTTDEGYLLAGYSDSFGSRGTEICLLKLDSSGNIEWEKTYGGNDYDFLRSVQQTSDGGYIVSGSTFSFGEGESDVFVLKLSAEGEIDPSCDLPGGSSVTIQNTSATYSYFNAIPQAASFTLYNTAASPEETSATENVICEARPTISGAVKTEEGLGIEGVIITFSGEEGTETTDSKGYYAHAVSYGWSGTATPSKTGYAFTPSSRSYTDVTSDWSSQDYTAFEACLIAGTVRDDSGVEMEGVTITFSNGGGTATTEADGSYSHPVIKGWTGTATAFKTCYAFTPPSRSYTDVTTDQIGQDYTGSLLIFTISGTILEASTLVPVSGVAMDGLPGGVTTDAAGYYEATVDCGWSGTVTPVKDHYIFYPAGRVYRNVASDQMLEDYTAYPAWIISGTVRTSGGIGIPGVSIAFSNNGGNTATRVDGAYSHLVVNGWSGTATPSRVGYSFNPPSIDYSNVSADQSGQDYTGTLIPYTLTINADSGGTTNPSPGTYTHYYGDVVTVTAQPESKYKFSIWEGDILPGHEYNNPILITITSDTTIRAVFEKEGLCFIATAVYGSPDHPHLRVLREFRNRYLLSNRLGRSFVHQYYEYSPLVADFIAKHKALKIVIRVNLIPIVALSYSLLYLGPVVTIFMFVFMFSLSAVLIFFYIKKRGQAPFFSI